MPARGSLKLSFAPVLTVVPKVRRRVGEYLQESGLPERAVDELLLALDELCNNAIEHGGSSALSDGDQDHSACELKLRADSERSEVIAAFRTRGHLDARELHAIMKSTGLPDIDSERGRGLFLFRAMVDSFQVTNSGEHWIEVRFKKSW